MGKTSFGLVSLVLLIGACAFDSTGTSVGGASLGDDDTGDGTETVSVSATTASSGSASASGGSTPSTSDPTMGMTSTDPTSATGSVSESESETQPTTSPTSSASESESQTVSESESATSQGTSTGEPTTGDPTEDPPDDPYPACPGGLPDCPDTHTCLLVDDGVSGSWCGEMDCTADDDCPDGLTGNAVPRCRGSVGDTFCVLDCSGDTAGCPDGMECMLLNVGRRCVWAA